MDSSAKQQPWYKKGLNFKCTGCGGCCTGSPGHVWIDAQEIENMADHLKISKEEFIKKYTRRIGQNFSLLEHSKTFDCVFLKDNACRIYEARPRQCRTYPWWPENVASKKAWDAEGTRCEGINHPESDVISLEEIQKQLSLN